MTPHQQQLVRGLPSISALLETEQARQWLSAHPRASVVDALQAAVANARNAIFARGTDGDGSPDALLAAAGRRLAERSAGGLVRVVNATGIVLHTGLGRAPLCGEAVEAIREAAGAYCNLEYDLGGGQRGRRQMHVAEIIRLITGADAATVVNNNAAATLLALRALAEGREVVVSRGELIEIGGSFRLPEIMSASGARLREVGTTNRTRIGDYEAAITDQTAMLLWVHTSNYRVVGFCESTPLADLVDLGHRLGLPVMADLGSGALFDLRELGLPYEPFVREAIEQGADVVCFSGDKLLGGPQCGILCGRADAIGRVESHPLMRTYRVDKLTLLALQATLAHCFDPQQAATALPTLAALCEPTNALAQRAQELRDALSAACPGESFLVCSDVAYAGGGSMPGCAVESVVVQWRPGSVAASQAASRLRGSRPPVVARVREDAVVFDLRTIRPLEYADVVHAVGHAAENLAD